MLTVITGPMGAGKTTLLIGKIRGLRAIGHKVDCYKPKLDTRSKYIEARGGNKIECKEIESLSEIDVDNKFIAISEFHMFLNEEEDDIVLFFQETQNVIVDGIKCRHDGYPFKAMSIALALADDIVFLKANCMACQKMGIATKTLRKIHDDRDIVIGDLGTEYITVCPEC